MILELDGVRKTYGSSQALAGCDLAVGPGELLAVLGLNGAGKTTLLRAMSGLVPVTSGHVVWDGQPLRREDLERRRRLLFVPDTPFLAPERTVLENLGLFLDAYEVERDAAFIADLLESFDLLETATAPVSSLSRGQAYKVGLATLFAVNTEMNLLDEPFASGMDAVGIGEFRRRSRRLVEEGGSLLYTTQLVDLALEFATRVVVLHDGRVHADLAPGDLRAAAAKKSDPVLAKLVSDFS